MTTDNRNSFQSAISMSLNFSIRIPHSAFRNGKVRHPPSAIGMAHHYLDHIGSEHRQTIVRHQQ
jgi:hypothetical protein